MIRWHSAKRGLSNKLWRQLLELRAATVIERLLSPRRGLFRNFFMPDRNCLWKKENPLNCSSHQCYCHFLWSSHRYLAWYLLQWQCLYNLYQSENTSAKPNNYGICFCTAPGCSLDVWWEAWMRYGYFPPSPFIFMKADHRYWHLRSGKLKIVELFLWGSNEDGTTAVLGSHLNS